MRSHGKSLAGVLVSGLAGGTVTRKPCLSGIREPWESWGGEVSGGTRIACRWKFLLGRSLPLNRLMASLGFAKSGLLLLAGGLAEGLESGLMRDAQGELLYASTMAQNVWSGDFPEDANPQEMGELAVAIHHGCSRENAFVDPGNTQPGISSLLDKLPGKLRSGSPERCAMTARKIRRDCQPMAVRQFSANVQVGTTVEDQKLLRSSCLPWPAKILAHSHFASVGSMLGPRLHGQYTWLYLPRLGNHRRGSWPLAKTVPHGLCQGVDV